MYTAHLVERKYQPEANRVHVKVVDKEIGGTVHGGVRGHCALGLPHGVRGKVTPYIDNQLVVKTIEIEPHAQAQQTPHDHVTKRHRDTSPRRARMGWVVVVQVCDVPHCALHVSCG